MDLTQIRYFLALAERLNFTRAAEACHVTQPALTKAIQRLEDELGGPLLLRERGDSSLTELGRTMLPLLRQTYEAADAARLGAAQFHRQDAMALRIGLDAWVTPQVLTVLLRELGPRFPTLEVSIRQGDVGQLSAWLMAAEIDVALTTEAAGLTAKANSWGLFEDAVVALVDGRHEGGAMSVEDMPWSRLIGRDLAPHGEPAHAPRHACGSEEQVWALVRAGLGFALTTARRAVPAELVSRPLTPSRSMAVHVAAMPGRRPSPAADTLVRLARALDWEGATA